MRAEERTVAPTLTERLARGVPTEVLVEFDTRNIDAELDRVRAGGAAGRAALDAQRAARYASLRDRVVAAIPAGTGELRTTYRQVPLAVIRVRDAATLATLLSRPDVRAVYEDRPMAPHLAESLPLIGQPAAVAAGAGGAGTTVAVLDSGVDYASQPAFGNCAGGPGSVGCRVAALVEIAASDGVTDDTKHGTNVAAIVLGVAPEARVVVLDVLEPSGTILPSKVLTAIDWVIVNRAAYNIVAVNMSFGGGDCVGALFTSPCAATYGCQANPLAGMIATLRNAHGILTAASAGNNGGSNALATPACSPAALSVGAVYDANVGSVTWSTAGCTDTSTAADRLACGSNVASFLGFLAPGSKIAAGGYLATGTSQAAPHLAGAIAVLRAAFPSDSIEATVQRLTASGAMVSGRGVSKPRIALGSAYLADAGGLPGARADLSVTATVSATTVPVGATVTVSARVTNAGPQAAGAPELDFAVPASLTVTSVPGGCIVGGGSVKCALGTLPALASTARELTARAAAAGASTIAVTTASAVVDPSATNNASTAALSITSDGSGGDGGGNGDRAVVVPMLSALQLMLLAALMTAIAVRR